MLKKIGIVTVVQWIIGLSVLSIAGSSLEIVPGLVLLTVLTAGNAVSFILAEKGGAG